MLLIFKKKIVVLNNIKNKLSSDKPTYEEFELAFIDLGYSDKYTKNKKLIQYILRKFDTSWRQEPLEYDLMTIEHIESQSSGNLSEDDKSSIGNLVLVTSEDNSDNLKNKRFSEKQEIFKRNYPHLDQLIFNSSQWTKEFIIKRARFLSKEAYDNIWSL